MFSKGLENNPVYLLLNRSEEKDARAYSGVLLLVEGDAQEALEYIKNVFPSFTSHGFNHSMRILSRIHSIMEAELQDSLTPPELFCLIMAAMFHDMGMADPDADDRYHQRKNHSLYAEKPLREFINSKLTLINEKKRLFNCILFVCQAHGMELGALYGDRRFYDRDTIEGHVLRFGLLAVLLRIGDLLDLDENRSNNFIRRFFPSYISEDSQPHHTRHEQIEKFYLSPEKVSIIVTAKDVNEYHIWEGWLNYLNEDILHANTYLMPKIGKNFHLPELCSEIIKDKDSNFETERLRFELTDKGAIWDILSQSVYTEEYDFIRELVQNGIDAVLMATYSDEKIELKTASPRGWDMWNRPGRVLVAYSERESRLVIFDNGTGMDLEAVKSFLFRVADSGYRNRHDAREFPFPAIAKFGIGFISCLSKCEEIIMLTQEGRSTGCKVRLFSNSVTAYFERTETQLGHGTTISMKLKRQYKSCSVKDYLTNTFTGASVPIDWLDLDEMKAKAEWLHECGELDKVPEFPLGFVMLYDVMLERYRSFDSRREQVHKGYMSDSQLLSEKMEMLEETLLDWKYRDGEELDCKSIERELSILLRSLTGLDRFLDVRKELAEGLKKLKNADSTGFENELADIFDTMSRQVKKIEDKRAEIGKLLRKCISPMHRVGLEKARDIIDVPLIAYELSAWINLIQISGKQNWTKIFAERCGIIFVRCGFDDWQAGVEFRSVHGFLFNRGILTTELKSLSQDSSHEIELEDASESWLTDMDCEYDLSELLDERAVEYDIRVGERITTNSFRIFIKEGDFYESKDTSTLVYNEASGFIEESSDRDDLKKFIPELIGEIDCMMTENSKIGGTDQLDQLCRTESTLSQDGILIDLDPRCLVPLGCNWVKINLTAGARLDLNVSRRHIDSAEEKIDAWLAKTGRLIQEKVLEQLLSTLKGLGLDCREEALCGQSVRVDGYLSRQSLEQMKGLIHEKL